MWSNVNFLLGSTAITPEYGSYQSVANISLISKTSDDTCLTTKDHESEAGAVGSIAIRHISSAFYRSIQLAIARAFTRNLPKNQGESATSDSAESTPINSPELSQTSFATSDGIRPRVAVIGAGITGVASAAHLITHGFEVVLFDRRDHLGGIWYGVNPTSGLQLHSFCYRFHPSVVWSSGTSVHQPEILSEIERVWTDYELKSRTRFNYNVDEISRFKTSDGSTKYIINNGDEGQFDGLILAIGTCGVPRKVDFKGRSSFKGQYLHSSELEKIDWTKNGRRSSLVCIGGGASGVEVIETVLDRLDSKPVLVTRNDKWFIPRNFFLSTLLALNLAGRRTWFDWICEKLIEKFHYGRGLKFMVPNQAIQSKAVKEPSGLFDQTPIVNDIFLKLVEDRKVEYVQAEIVQIHENGVEIRARASSKSSKTRIIPADIIVECTGYDRPEIKSQSIQDLFKNQDEKKVDYSPPNLFLGNITVHDWSCVMLNSAYVHGVGSVGHFHIGIFNRMLMMFLVDQATRPNCNEMKRWVDQKSQLKNGSLCCYTYTEMMLWLIVFMVFNHNRLRWVIFVLFGFGKLIIYYKVFFFAKKVKSGNNKS
ncbi:hypothetical protein BY996DRAFT_4581794 [Phakopsora pachyrhizi]|uniref:Expressed protein n=1 Tax=Phakopsora pachyrhizi TaxID=170000 RepID=A0AAV0BPS6_PHAPC|nr:hypothetical protein BY996DRAFT_4581794 [Phakopsora pachyrhizi]CAH7688361.1 expressed protein [Phakopsora pachyrhizi]